MDLKEIYTTLTDNNILRQDQVNFVDTIIDSFSNRSRAKNSTVIEAWTGFGKTRSVLLASILSRYLNIASQNTSKIIISCLTKEQQANYLSELKKIKKDVENLLNIKVKVLGSYSCLIDDEDSKLLEDEEVLNAGVVKILFLKGKSNYILKKRLKSLIEETKEEKERELLYRFASLLEKAFGDLEVAKLIDKEGIINKVKKIENIDSLRASIYTDVRKLNEDEYIIKLRKLAAKSDIIITNHFLVLRYTNLLYNEFIKNIENGKNSMDLLPDVEKVDVSVDYVNLLKQTDFAFEEEPADSTASKIKSKANLIINYNDFIIFDEAHNLMHVYIHTASRSRTLRKGLILYDNLLSSIMHHVKKKTSPLEDKDFKKAFDSLVEKVENLKSLIDTIRKNKEEILSKSREKIELENLAPLIFLEQKDLELIYSAVSLNLSCLESLEAVINRLTSKLSEKLDDKTIDDLGLLKKEIEEDRSFFTKAEREVKNILTDKKRTLIEDENKIIFSRTLLDFSDELNYPSLLFACDLKTFAKKVKEFAHVVYTSATLSTNNETRIIAKIEKGKFKEHDTEALYKELHIYPLQSLGINAGSIRNLKIFIPQFAERSIDTIYYTDTYLIPKPNKKEEFDEILKTYYLNLIIPEINSIIRKDFLNEGGANKLTEVNSGTCIILGKSFKEIDYIRERLEEPIKKFLINQGDRKENFTLTIEKLKKTPNSIGLFVNRYEGFNLPELSLLIITRVPFISYESLYILHNTSDKGTLNVYNYYEAVIKIKQLIGRLMRFAHKEQEKKLYIIDSRIQRFKTLLHLYEEKKICNLITKAIADTKEQIQN
ncbi:MAG: helicase C-terminal domain-containing protein [Archaeoglobaceae archaeon]